MSKFDSGRNRRIPKAIAVSFASLAFGLMASAWAAETPIPTPENISIKSITAGGSGCPQGSYTVLVTSSVPGGPADFFEVVYDKFSIEKGPGLSLSDSRKFCTLLVDMVIPQGFRFSLVDVHYEGFASIPAGSAGSMKVEYFFPHFSERSSTSKSLPGPFYGDYNRDDSLSLFTAVYSPCGRDIPLNLKTSINLLGPANDRAFMTVDQNTGILTQKFALQWATCD